MSRVLFFSMMLVGLLTSNLSAAVMGVSNASSIQAQGVIDWGNLGPDGTIVTQPFSINVTGLPTYSAMVSNNAINAGNLQRRDEGTSWGGNFGPGEELLWTRFASGVISIEFNNAVAGTGAQIQHTFLGAFTAKIEAFDAGNVSLGAFSFVGNSTGDVDDTAIFVGVLSNVANIKRVTFVASQPGEVDSFAINNVVVQATPTGVVPEPASVAIFGIGTGLALVAARRKLKK